MSTYRIQDGCHNCKYVFVKVSHEDPPEFYCEFNAERPKSNFTIRSNENTNLNLEEFESHIKELNKWEQNQEVNPCGICMNHRRKEN